MPRSDALALSYSHLLRCTNSELWTSRQQLWQATAIPAPTWNSLHPRVSPLLSPPLTGPPCSLMAPNMSTQLHLDQLAQRSLELLSQCKYHHFLSIAPVSFKRSPMSFPWPALQGIHGSAHALEASCSLQQSLPSPSSFSRVWAPTHSLRLFILQVSVLEASLPWTLID